MRHQRYSAEASLGLNPKETLREADDDQENYIPHPSPGEE